MPSGWLGHAKCPDLMARTTNALVVTALGVALAAPTAWAQSPAPSAPAPNLEIRQDRREIRQDRREIRDDKREIREDRAKLRKDRKAGDTAPR